MNMIEFLLGKSSDYQNISIGDIKFYIIASILLVVLFVIFFIFSKTKGFKVRKRKEINEQKDIYVNPQIIKVQKADIDKELYNDKSVSESKKS